MRVPVDVGWSARPAAAGLGDRISNFAIDSGFWSWAKHFLTIAAVTPDGVRAGENMRNCSPTLAKHERIALRRPVPISAARERIAGVCLLNDWSARDIQAWEYVPLGPFLAKNFATTVSPWIVTAGALEPFRIAQQPRSEGDPAPLPYLLDEADQLNGALAISIEVSLRTRAMRETNAAAFVLGRTVASHLYWTPAQLVTHHTVNGCDLAAGDLLGTGTISGPDDDARGSLMELTKGGRNQIALPDGETRTFLEDGDEVRMTGRAERDGYRTIGLGECVARVHDRP